MTVHCERRTVSYADTSAHGVEFRYGERVVFVPDHRPLTARTIASIAEQLRTTVNDIKQSMKDTLDAQSQHHDPS